MSVSKVVNSIKQYEYGRRFIDPAALASVRHLSLIAKHVVEGFISGLHRSPFHGFSLDFAEYRAYTPGDDIRSIDWKVYGRSDRFYVKKFEGDTNTQVYLLLDCSRSMEFTSHKVSKLDYARYLTASIAYLAQRQKDAAGLVTFDSEVRHYTPARIRRGHFNTLLHQLEEAQVGDQTDIGRAIEDLARLTRKKNLLVLISDFYQDPAAVTKALRFFHLRGNDMVLFHVLDPTEIDPPFDSIQTLEDMETKERVTYAPEVKKAYVDRLQSHIEQLKRESSEMKVDYQLLSTDKPLDQALYRYLSSRAKNY